ESWYFTTMSTETLAKLFGSPSRAKLLRLFIFNPGEAFLLSEIQKRTRIKPADLKKEVLFLEGLEILSHRKAPQIETTASGRKKRKTHKPESLKHRLWSINEEFFFVDHLRALFSAEFFANRDDMAKRFKNCGRIKLILLSGIFIQDGGSRADMLVVGDDIKKKEVEKVINSIEIDIGRELTYAILETRDFIYRLSSSDKFIRDILDYPHKRIVDKFV
ncbi:MAG: hypothetical protein NTV48_01655, partial [Candidatus Vogelbacteria bacterium]|nr:hypothetical protein [Candidatus Vogelbacteria bacterium]